MIELHHFWRSSASWRVRWALEIKGISPKLTHVDIVKGEQRATTFTGALSPIGHVPTIVVDGRSLSESVAILEWLDETRPTPALYPRDAWQRARCRQIVELINAGTQPLQNLIVFERLGGDEVAKKTWAAPWIARGLAAVESVLVQLEGEGITGPHALGDSVTAADLFVVPQLPNARRFEVDMARFPRILRLEAAALATAACVAAHPERHKPT